MRRRKTLRLSPSLVMSFLLLYVLLAYPKWHPSAPVAVGGPAGVRWFMISRGWWRLSEPVAVSGFVVRLPLFLFESADTLDMAGHRLFITS